MMIVWHRSAVGIFLVLMSALVGGAVGPAAVAARAAAPPDVATGKLLLVENAQSRSVIVLAANAAAEEKQASQELQQYLQKISGANVEVATEPRADQIPIRLGQAAATPELLAAIKAKGTDPDSFILKADADGVRVVGLSPEGTLFGVYELLEQLGVRWFMPGAIGTVIPNSATVAVGRQETVQVPSFNGRWDNAGRDFPEWGQHMRMGGPRFPPAHGMKGFSRDAFAQHPEYFALVDGKRTPRQLCVSNPDVLRLVTEHVRSYFRAHPDEPWIGMGPNDGGGFCECDNCRALDGNDHDPLMNTVSMTDRYIWFFNQVLDGIKDEFPNKKIAFYSYADYIRPPVRYKPNPHIVPAFAPISLCRVHGMDNPICPERATYKPLIEAWGKILPELYERGYWFNLADPGFPFSEVHKMRDEVPAVHALGIRGWREETLNHWGSETPSLYIGAKLMWNHQADVDALLRDFYEKFFGPAEQPMTEYCTMMDAALRDADFHTGGAFDMPQFYPAALRDKARQRLDAAAKAAGTGIYGERVKIFRTTFDYLETFIAMQEHRNALDFLTAHSDLQKLDALQTTLMAYDPPMINRHGREYLKRFYRQPVEQGFARVSNGNELAVPLRDEWQFQTDPQRTGEADGLWRAATNSAKWRPLKTTSLSWSDQGLRYYKGEAWYRQEVEIPARFENKRIFLWFGGVDEKAKVWVNDKLVGISPGKVFLPFEMDATDAVRPGARNVVTVRLVNQRMDEVGTGGITGPVMFYAPPAGKDAKLENARELATTFP
jgi:hypothetical protein